MQVVPLTSPPFPAGQETVQAFLSYKNTGVVTITSVSR